MTEEGGSPVEGTGEAPAPEAGQAGGTPVNDTGSAKTDDGQGSKAPAPEAGQAKEAPGGEKSGSAKTGEDEPPKFDGDTLKWITSKGYGENSFDPANEDHVKFINSSRESEKLATKAAQEKKNQEIIEKAKTEKAKPKADADGKAVEGPLAEFEKGFEDKVQQAMKLLRVTTAEELHAKDPQLYSDLQASYPIERQKAWEANQKWQSERESEILEQEKVDNQLRSDFEKARTTSEENLNAVRAKYPDLDKNFAKYGVNDFVKALSDKYSVFQEILFLDKEVAGFLALAADSIAYRHNEDARKEEWKQDYEKERLKQGAANGPRPAGVGPGGGGPTAENSSSKSWDNNLTKNAKKLVEQR